VPRAQLASYQPLRKLRLKLPATQIPWCSDVDQQLVARLQQPLGEVEVLSADRIRAEPLRPPHTFGV
jgi:hypothetical protein